MKVCVAHAGRLFSTWLGIRMRLSTSVGHGYLSNTEIPSRGPETGGMQLRAPDLHGLRRAYGCMAAALTGAVIFLAPSERHHSQETGGGDAGVGSSRTWFANYEISISQGLVCVCASTSASRQGASSGRRPRTRRCVCEMRHSVLSS